MKRVTLVVTCNGNWQQLTLGAGLVVDPNRKQLCRSVAIQANPANSNPSFVAGVNRLGVAPSGAGDYDTYIPAPVTGIPTAPLVIGDTMSGPGQLVLENIWVKGTNTEILRIGIQCYP